MFCYKCGEENPDEAKFCKNCGALLKEEEETAKKVEVIEAPNYQQNKQQTTDTSSNKSDSSDWIGCCICLIVIFIIFAIAGIL